VKASTPYATQPAVDELDLEALAPGELHHLMVNIVTNALGVWTWIPVIVARGHEPGPVVAVTGAVHGNELNGIRIVQRLFHRLHGEGLRGTVIGVPIVNVPGYRENRREFIDGNDLNRIMPGRENGNCAEVYAHRVLTRVVDRADYLIDLHTASAGRINSIYVRADMTNPVTTRMALLQQAQIIVHNKGRDGTLRGAVGVPAITVEVGDPQRFQRGAIRDGLDGVENVLVDLAMLPRGELKRGEDAVLCSRSYWIYTDTGGVLEVFPQLADHVEHGERIARVSSIFGDVIREHQAPEDGIVVGKSISPVNRTGARVLHLGVVGTPEGACEPVPSLARGQSSS
jgi:predicted deacylase